MEKLWFGNKQHFQWVPMPSTGIQRRNVFSQETATLDRGGAFSSRSVGRHAEFDFSFGAREAYGSEGLDVYQEYATGYWDDFGSNVNGFNPNNLIYFIDPMTMRANLFSPHWATPMLSLSGDYPPLGFGTLHSATPANIYRQPLRGVNFDITHTANTLPSATGQRFILPIPPGYTLRWGWSGSVVTGTPVIRAESHNALTGAIAQQSATPLSPTGAQRMNASINGDTYDYVTFGLSRTTAVASQATVYSMMAQLWRNGTTINSDGNHIPGVGQTGCVIMDDMIEEYIQADDLGNRHLKGLSFGLLEVGAWLA